VSTGAVVALAWMLSAAVSAAQTRPDATTTGGSARVSLLKGGEMGELLTVYVPRNESEVQRLLADSRDTEASMEGAVERTQKLVIEADGRARIMKEELEATRVRRDVARKLKDAAAMAQLESAFQRQDREHSYLEDLREALRADIDRIETERQAAASRTKALELEMRVVQRHRVLTSPNRSASGSGSGTQPAAAAVRTPTPEELAHYRGLLRDMLDAQRDAAGRWATAAERRRVLAERKIKQLEALTRLTAPKSSGR
jgi:hypothetical protein